MLAGPAIEREVIAVAARGQQHLSRPAAAEFAVHQHRRLRRVPVVRVVRRRLVEPLQLPGIDVHGHDGAGKEIVHPFAARLRRVGRRRVAGAEDIQVRLGIVDARNPGMAAAVARRIEALPRLKTRIARIHRHRVEAPLLLPRFRIERHQIAGRVKIVPGADDDVIADGRRRRGKEVLLAERRRFLVPALRASSRVDRHEIVVGRDEIEIVAPHGHAAIADVCAASRLPEVMPQLVAVVRVERPHVVGRRHVEHPVHHQHSALDRRLAGDDDVAGAFAADDNVPGARRPSQRQVLHVRLIDLGQRAVSTSRVIARIGRPRIGQRFQQLGGIKAAAGGAHVSGGQAE